MRKLFALILILFLAACGAAEPAESPTAEPETAAEPTTATESSEAAEAEPATEETAVADDDETTAVANLPATTVAEAAVLRDVDWVKGAETPAVTIIEYGDFQ